MRNTVKRIVCVILCLCIIICSNETANASKTKKITYYGKNAVAWRIDKYGPKDYKKCKYVRRVGIYGNKFVMWVSKGKKTVKYSYSINKKTKYIVTNDGNRVLPDLKKDLKLRSIKINNNGSMTIPTSKIMKKIIASKYSMHYVKITVKGKTVVKLEYCIDGGDPCE